jgi:hypothetical protein
MRMPIMDIPVWVSSEHLGTTRSPKRWEGILISVDQQYWPARIRVRRADSTDWKELRAPLRVLTAR